MTDHAPTSLQILILGNLAPYRIGGAEVQARLLADCFVRRGHRVTAAGYANPDERLPVGGAGDKTIEAVHLPSLGRHRITRAVSYAVSVICVLLHRRQRCDVVLCYMLGESDLVLSLLKQSGLLRVPLIACSAGFGRSGDAARLASLPLSPWLIRMLKRQVNIINIISPEIAKELTSLGLARHFSHIPNGVALDDRQQAVGRRHGRQRSFLFAGRLVRLKGCADLIKAVRHLKDSNIPFRVNIVGDGPQSSALYELSKEYGVDDKIIFHGEVHPDRMAEHYRDNTILVLPSHCEAQGMVVAEAMSFGLPVIVTRSGGPEFTVDPRMARICPTKNPAALAAAMKEMLDLPGDELSAMGAAARQHVRQHFDIESVADQFIHLFRRLTSGRGG